MNIEELTEEVPYGTTQQIKNPGLDIYYIVNNEDLKSNDVENILYKGSGSMELDKHIGKYYQDVKDLKTYTNESEYKNMNTYNGFYESDNHFASFKILTSRHNPEIFAKVAQVTLMDLSTKEKIEKLNEIIKPDYIRYSDRKKKKSLFSRLFN